MTKISTLPGMDPTAMSGLAQGQSDVDKAKALQMRGLKSEKEVDKAAGGFEALLLHQLMKEMWKSVDQAGLFGEDNHQAQVYRDMFHQAIAESIAEGRGIGIKQYLKGELLKVQDASNDRGTSGKKTELFEEPRKQLSIKPL